MGNEKINISCYADDTVLIAESEDDLQHLLNMFCSAAKIYVMPFSTEKAKSMRVSRESIRCNLVADNKIIKHVKMFNYLGLEITCYEYLENEVRHQVNKENRTMCLNDMIWRNKHINSKVK